NWVAAVVNRPETTVREAISKIPHTRLLIINTPSECVVGGLRDSVLSAIKALGCDAIFLEGVVSVHCDAAAPVAEAYRALHLFPTTQPPGIRFYSCAAQQAYELTSEACADSILAQAVRGFDFPATIGQAYADGTRIFLELGPGSSCTRMIQNILGENPHRAVSICVRGENDYLTILKALGTLTAEGVPVQLSALYGPKAWPTAPVSVGSAHMLSKPVGGAPSLPVLRLPTAPESIMPLKPAPKNISTHTESADKTAGLQELDPSTISHILDAHEKQVEATSKAHQKFLDFSKDLNKAYAQTVTFQTRLIHSAMTVEAPDAKDSRFDAAANEWISKPSSRTEPEPETITTPPAYDRNLCIEFAVGSAARVLGPQFAPVDTYGARVRLPDEPLMLVDRIVSIQAEKGALGPGQIVTEHDVRPDAWYLDGGRAPVCISVEAGQADLFLCAYMGIDLLVKGKRTYRLLDAKVDFFRHVARPGETIRYEIEIERFTRHGETYLFFFHFNGTINGAPLIRMRDGCAGFFTDEEVRNSGGIILTDDEPHPSSGKKPIDWVDLVPMETTRYDATHLDALRDGNLSECFGPAFTNIPISPSLVLPSGRMRLFDRILNLTPDGGRFGLGSIQAEADIHPDDWFLTCHFVDDMVMPGTLMYECCAHTLRVFLQRMGWVLDRPDVCYEPLTGVQSRLKCRGPVTPKTRKVVYAVEIKELGYGPEPFAIANANMYADGRHIVYFENLSIKLSGATREDLLSFWGQYGTSRLSVPPLEDKPVFGPEQVLSFAAGNPSDAFGEPYRVFDRRRFIARLPRPPYSLLSRIIHAEPKPWKLEPGGWVTAQYDVPPDAWYFQADRNAKIPISILMEVALQPCGWLAAYAGSALKSDKDLRFRNLDGSADLHFHPAPAGDVLTTRARMTNVSAAGDMIIEAFEFEVTQQGNPIYTGTTQFGFFTETALAQQVGLGSEILPVWPDPPENQTGLIDGIHLEDIPPFDPGQCDKIQTLNDVSSDWNGLLMPARAIRMIDRIDRYSPEGGTQELGHVQGSKTVDPTEWFFRAHFFQDPVCPGSLGIESFGQLIKWVARKRWHQYRSTHRFELNPANHRWIYRGQIRPENKQITVEADIISIEESPIPTISANGYLKVDGLYIYKMENFGIRLIPIDDR
ncbi:MAG: type I polyketide synthase, partial [Deltaproteobacteria bacterium]|nr:type I polyketide synthase [Deltaproteobacteria bacterium]